MTTTDLVFASLASCLVVAAGVTDLHARVIPNRLTLPVIVAAPLFHLLRGGPGALGHSLLSMVLVSLVPLAAFVRGGMGGGDVKLFAALGALLGVQLGLQVQLGSLLLAGLYASVVLTARGQLLVTLARSLRVVRTQLAPEVALQPGASLRLGPAIAAATLAVVWFGGALP